MLATLSFPLILAQAVDQLDPQNLQAFAQLLLQAAQSRNGFLLLALALIGAVYLVRKFLAPKVPFLETDLGGALLVLVQSFAGAIATAMIGGGHFDSGLALDALKIAFAAAGGFKIVKELIAALFPKTAAQISAEAAKAGQAAASNAQPPSLEVIVNKLPVPPSDGAPKTDLKAIVTAPEDKK